LLFNTSRYIDNATDRDDRGNMLISNRDDNNISPDSINGNENNKDNDDKVGKYSQQYDKDNLISRLLEDHNMKSRPKTADEIIAASSLRNSIKSNYLENEINDNNNYNNYYYNNDNIYNNDNNYNNYDNTLMSTMRVTEVNKGWELNNDLGIYLCNSLSFLSI
jgi:hypothetical protein